MIVFVGFMGSGKSTVGRAVAEKLKLSFTDSDEVIADEYGPIADYFSTYGEAAFRDLESATIARLLHGSGVLALGGGACERAETRACLRGHQVIFLSVSFAVALRRIGTDPNRPLLNDPKLRHRFDERQAQYAAVATDIIEVNHDSTDEVVAAVLLRLAQRDSWRGKRQK